LRPTHHLAASAVFSVATFAVTHSVALTAVNFTAGVFIDVDHVPEYLLRFGFKKNPLHFLEQELHMTSKKTVLFLHGFDILTLIFGLMCWAGAWAWAWAFYIGAVQHLILDVIYNPIKTPWSFFLSYRIFHKFDTDKIYHREVTKSFWRKKRKAFFT
jgi:hypothetical protein